jgi:hypothetical protein
MPVYGQEFYARKTISKFKKIFGSSGLSKFKKTSFTFGSGSGILARDIRP